MVRRDVVAKFDYNVTTAPNHIPVLEQRHSVWKSNDGDLIDKVELFLLDGGAKTEVSKGLGVNRSTIYRMIEEGRLPAWVSRTGLFEMN